MDAKNGCEDIKNSIITHPLSTQMDKAKRDTLGISKLFKLMIISLVLFWQLMDGLSNSSRGEKDLNPISSKHPEVREHFLFVRAQQSLPTDQTYSHQFCDASIDEVRR